MTKRFGVTCACLSFLFLGCHRSSGPPFRIPPEESKLKSPIDAIPAAVTQGDQTYHGSNCALCHGNHGNGRGYMSGASNLNCRNWEDPASLADYTDGDLFYIISKGKSRMPGYEGHFKPQEVWMMVAYIRALPKKAG